MKNILLTLLAVCGMQSAFAQSTVVRGDMDGDGNVTVGDLTETVDVVLGRKAVQIISADVDAYKVDNTLVQGTWNASDGSSVTFNADGTTSLGSGWTYKFRPVQGQISVYDAANVRQRVYNVTEIDDTHMALGEYGKNYTTFYYKGNFIKLSETKLTLVVDDTYTLSASMMPGGTASFTWTSSDSDVAMVTKSGKVMASAEGSCVITCAATDGSGISGTCAVTVVSAMPVSTITLSDASLDMMIGESQTLTASVAPADAANQTVQWASSNEAVATVTSDGVVTAISMGQATITCAATDGSGVVAVCGVNIARKPVSSFALSDTQFTLTSGSRTLTATASPADATTTAVVWSSSDEGIARVSQNGEVTAGGVKDGVATITATAADGSGASASCQVYVITHEYVDLGLPSGTLWATLNIGADYPTQPGDFFCWGETKGLFEGKTFFDWTTYAHCMGTQTSLLKYNSKASSGTVDDKTELDEADDAAYVNWGSVWRTPSEAQIEELVSNTTVTYANGGYTITSKLNGNYIVMAASDYFKKSGKYEPSVAQTYYYYYMTRSLHTNMPTNCYLLELSRYNSSSGTYTYSISKGKTNLRTYGYPVRPVLNVQP